MVYTVTQDFEPIELWNIFQQTHNNTPRTNNSIGGNRVSQCGTKLPCTYASHYLEADTSLNEGRNVSKQTNQQTRRPNKRTNKRGDPSINDNNKLYDTRNKRPWKQALGYNPQNTHQFLARLCHEPTHARDVFTYFAFCNQVSVVPFIRVGVFR